MKSKSTIAALVTVLLFSPLPSALAQREGHGGMASPIPTGPTDSSARMFVMMATENQRTALAKCLESAERTRMAIRQMGNIGSPWSRSRVSYVQQDLDALQEYEEHLQSALGALTKAHQSFWNMLSQAQESGLEPRLKQLDHLQDEMNFNALGISQDVMDAKLGPAPPKIKWDVNTLSKEVDKWLSEHREIAKEMGIPS